MRKLPSTTRNNAGMITSALCAVASITLLMLDAFDARLKPAQNGMLGLAGVLALIALVSCVAASHRRGNTWCDEHRITAWRLW